MKRIIPFILFLLTTIPMANSPTIDVNVSEVLEGKISSFFLNQTMESGFVGVKIEFNNIGSTLFKARIRMEIFEGKKTIYTLWSDEKILNPADKKSFDIFSYINKTGSYDLKIRVYYGSEILDYENISFEVKNLKNNQSDIFEIKRLRCSDDYIKFDLKSRENLKNVFFLFSNYPASWIIEQKKITSLKRNDETPLNVKYIPPFFSEKEIMINIFTDDGKFYKTEKVILKNEYGIWKIINDFLDIVIKVF